MARYLMPEAFTVDDARNLSGDLKLDDAVSFTWSELANDMRDELPETMTRDDLKFISYDTAGSNPHYVRVTFEAPCDDLGDYLLGIERL